MKLERIKNVLVCQICYLSHLIVEFGLVEQKNKLIEAGYLMNVKIIRIDKEPVDKVDFDLEAIDWYDIVKHKCVV
jgi:hypothetical protein